MSSFKEQFGNFFNLPEEIILNRPLIMLVGEKKLYLENHNGIALYQKDLIKIRLKIGILEIKGDKLEIEKIEAVDLLISGDINSLAYKDN